MAVFVKTNQQEENELICGVSNDCVLLQPTKLEPEPLNFVSINNGLYEPVNELYNTQTTTYQQLTSCQTFPNVSEVMSGSELTQSEVQQNEIYESTEEYPNIEPTPADLSEHSSSTLSAPMQEDFYEIQVAEEEVVSDIWNIDHTEVVVEGSKPNTETNNHEDDVEIPLPQDQDIYSQMHPYPCDFCSRRFSKKSTLMSHMVSHQTERPHGCNLCGARYRRKCDLVNHLKIHAFPPPRTILDDEEEELRSSDKGRRKKAQSLTPKKNSFSSDMSDTMDFKEEKKLGKTKFTKKGSKGMAHNYVDEDMRLLSELNRNSEVVKKVPQKRWPVIDQSRPYVCQHCGVSFAREKALGSHSRIHGGDSPFECNVCGEMFWDLSLMREHARLKHPQQDSFGGSSSTIYTGDDRFGSFHCDTCNLSFHHLDLLKKHRKTHFIKTEPMQEVGDDDHVCTVCGQFFENATELRAHAETHMQETHNCLDCGARFSDAVDLGDHMRNVHSEEGSCMCQACGKVCKDRRGLAKHSCSQADDAARTFPCYSCNKRFHSRARLRRHMVSHRDKAVSCSDCGEEFPDGRALMSHRHSHNTSQHPARSFPCHDCGKTFGSRSSQQIHVRIHTGERPYGCRFCWKAFADGGTLRKHERIHTGEKPYVCPVCPKAFNQRVVLREHIRAHHSGADSKVNSCYECKVCHYLCSSSSELCVHLVQHSDENTAKHRMPSLGPRKYKRRRKLGPAAPKVSNSPKLQYESSNSSDSSFTKKIIKKKFDYGSPPSHDLGDSVVQSFANSIEDIDSLLNKSEPKKPKLDKTLKKHKTKALSKLTKLARIEKRAKAAKLLNNTSYASKYVVSRPDELKPDGQARPRTKNVTFPSLEDSMDTILNGSDNIRNRPRTKNVNYHNMKVTKLEPATFPLTKSRNKKTKVKKTFVKKERTKSVSNEFINGVKSLDELVDPSVHGEEKLETCIVDDFNIEGVHHEIKTEDVPQRLHPVMIKSEMLSCEMCGDIFIDRSELLAHIRVHI